MSEASNELDFEAVIPSEQPEQTEQTEQAEQLPQDRPKAKLTAKDKEIIAYNIGRGATWDEERSRLTTHTRHLKSCHEDLKLKGVFDTNSEGKHLEQHNCFGYCPGAARNAMPKRFQPLIATTARVSFTNPSLPSHRLSTDFRPRNNGPSPGLFSIAGVLAN